MLPAENELLEPNKMIASQQESPIVDESYKLFLINKAIRNRKSWRGTDCSAISEYILLNNGIYIDPNECCDIANRYSFLIKKSSMLEIAFSLATMFLIIYVGDGGSFFGYYSIIFLPFVFNFYSAIAVNIKILFFSPAPLVPSASRCESSLMSTAIVIASRNEPFLVAQMTFDSALALSFPANKKEIIVVDNSDISFPQYNLWKEYVESFADNGSKKIDGVRVVFIHRDGTEGFKPRNLDLAMDAVTAELLLYLDVDSTVLPDTLLRIAPMFKWDEKIGFVQLYTLPTNANGKSPLAFAQSVRNYFLRLEMVFLTHASHSLFYGHNAIWRADVVRALGNCLEYHRNEVVVTEDLSMSFRARFHGHYGVGAWLESGEWVPESMRETEAMWLRWTVGTYQVYAKHFTQLKNLTMFTKLELLGWIQNVGYSINYGLVPLYVVLGLLLNSTLLMWMVVMSLLPEVIQALCAFYKLSLGEMKAFKKFCKCYAAFFILSTFVNWVRCIGLLCYLAGVKQGWTPTGKSSESEISFIRVIKERYGFLLLGVGCFSYSIILLINETTSFWNFFLISMMGFYGLNSLLCVYLFGKARMHDELRDVVAHRQIGGFSDFYLKSK
ncbi:MAG: glycosyltransferase [Pseudomonadota bacterium]